jgi:methanethiol S-methyltransferase
MRRVSILACGVVAYVAFLATLSYAIGFVGGRFVPRNIDNGPVSNSPWDIGLNVALLGLFAVQHTIMARPAFKAWWTRLIPREVERSTFVLAASGCLWLTFCCWRALPIEVWRIENRGIAAALDLLSLAGYGLVVYASFVIDHFELFGLKQAWYGFLQRPLPENGFASKSVYRYVRHPLMTGFLIAFWVTPTMSVGHLLFAAVVTGYILLGTRIEERDLVRALGEDYRRYSESTPRFFPRMRPMQGITPTAVRTVPLPGDRNGRMSSAAKSWTGDA